MFTSTQRCIRIALAILGESLISVAMSFAAGSALSSLLRWFLGPHPARLMDTPPAKPQQSSCCARKSCSAGEKNAETRVLIEVD